MMIKIIPNSAPISRTGLAIFLAQDNIGIIQIWITQRRWEHFWLSLPGSAADEDRLAHALDLVEQAATKGEASTTADGERILFVG